MDGYSLIPILLDSGGDHLEKIDIFKDIAERTGGDIYLGVVGAVRTGKSTFIKKFMELVVIPNINNEADRAVAKMNCLKVQLVKQL